MTEASQLPSPHAHRNRPTEVAPGGTGLFGAGLFGVAQKLVKRLSGRPDREHEMSRNRLIWGSGILTYVFLVAAGDGSAMSRPQLIASVYVVMALLLFGHLVIFPGISVGRRIVGMIADFATLSWGLHAGGEYIGVLWPFYLWVIFGNGFRFGVEYLYLATGFAVSGFAVVVFTTAYWAANRMLGIGLLAGMIGLPLYAATLIHKLSQAKLQAERASQAKSRFLASVSHELRTPLNAVIGLSDLLRSSKLDVGQQDMVSTIKISARSLLSLIDDILDLSRIEAGEMPARVVDFSLYEMLSEIRAMLSVQAQAKGIRLNVHVTPRTPAAVRGDRRQIEEVLINLASNAVKFTDRGGVVIAVDGYVDGYSGGTEDEIALRVEVTDSGIGVAPEAQGRIFESFTQADESISNRFGGTGLGLAISRQLVRLLGGEIGVHSELGVGSTFWFTVTLKRPAEARTPGIETRSQLIIVSGDGAAGEHLASLAAPLCPDRLVVRNPAIALQLLRTPYAAGVRQRVLVFDARHCEEDAKTFAAAFAHRNAENVAMVLICANAAADLPPMPMRAYFAACVAEENLESQFAAAIRIACLGETLRLPAEEQPAGARRGFRLLLVDDNRINQKVIAKTLEAGGHEVIVVGDGEQALDALETSRFDLVLMDINMPVLDGLETTKLYRAMTMGQFHLPIVGLTADATPEAAQHCAEAGMDACITKPIEAPRLLELIDQLVPETPQTAPASTGLVADLSKDPRFQGAGRPALDPQKLEELLTLGGQEFVSDIASAFLTDGMQLLEELRSAAARGDTRRFRDKLHALRSSAANVGARAIDELCFDWRQITTAELLAHGEDHVRRVEIEFERVRDLLPGHGVELTQSGTSY